MLIDLSFFEYIFTLIFPLAALVVCTILRKKPIKTVLISILVYIIAIAITRNIFPLRLGVMAFEPEKKLFLGFITPPFAGFDLSFMSILIAFKVYWEGIVFGIVIGFISVLAIKPLRKLRYAAIFIAALEIILAAALIIPDIFSPFSQFLNSTQFILSFVFYFAGYGLAKLVFVLIPNLLKYIDSEAKTQPKKVDIRPEKIS